jgi:hypothetical protein
MRWSLRQDLVSRMADGGKPDGYVRETFRPPRTSRAKANVLPEVISKGGLYERSRTVARTTERCCRVHRAPAAHCGLIDRAAVGL